MIDDNTLMLFRNKIKSLSSDGKGDVTSKNVFGITRGLVVNTDDPLEEGRIQIYCPAFNDDPKKIQHLPWVTYVSPFGGSIDNKNYTRGPGDVMPNSDGAVHYGMWGICELGAEVAVGCFDGDPTSRFWFGSVPAHQETHTQFNGRFDWSAEYGTPDGPLTSLKKPIQPIYDNWTSAFVDRKAREWKTRGADFQVTTNPDDGTGSPSKLKGDAYIDEPYEKMAEHEPDAWVRSILGANGYDWSGYKGVGAFKSSRVFGMSTPGFHSFSMDDRAFNSRIKFRTSSGHLFIMDDTNERIYVMTNKGKNWVEMDSNGNIDVFADRRVSIHSNSDINLTAGTDIRLLAGGGIHLYAGHTSSGDHPALDYTPNDGEIRIQSEYDTHMISQNLRQKTYENAYTEVGINKYDVVKGSSFMDVTDNINVSTITGDYIKSVARDLFETITNDSKRFSYGTSAVSSVGDNENHSFNGGVTIGSKNDTTIKSATGNIGMNAVAGNVSSKGTNSEMQIGGDGITAKSDKDVAIEGKKVTISVPSATGSAPVDISSIPENNCSAGNMPTSFPSWASDPTPRTLSGSEMAELAYSAGFRGRDLTMAVAVMMAESTGGTGKINDNPPDRGTSRGVYYTGSYGLFQIRAPETPFPAGDFDAFRNNVGNRLLIPKENAKAAFEMFKKAVPKSQWSANKWSTAGNGMASANLAAAQAAVDSRCGIVSGMSGFAPMPFGGFLPSSPSGDTSIVLTDTMATISSTIDIEMRTLSSHFNSYNNLVDQLNVNTIKTSLYGYGVGLVVDKLGSLVSGFSIPMSFDLGCLADDLFSNVIPPSLMAIVGDIQNMAAMLEGLGFPDLELTLENLKDQLTADMLAALGLPSFDLTSIIDPMLAGCAGGVLAQLGELSKTVDISPIEPIEIPDFRPVVHKIFGEV